MPAVPYLEPGDRVEVAYDLLGLTSYYFITSIQWTYGAAFMQTLELVLCTDVYPYTNWFIVGTSALGAPPTSGVGRLGW